MGPFRPDSVVDAVVADETPSPPGEATDIGSRRELFVDTALSLVDANPAALRLLGASREQARPGEHVLELVREKELVALLEAALADGRSTATLRVARDGGSSALAAEAFRVGGDASGAEAVLVAVLRETPSPHAV